MVIPGRFSVCQSIVSVACGKIAADLRVCRDNVWTATVVKMQSAKRAQLVPKFGRDCTFARSRMA